MKLYANTICFGLLFVFFCNDQKAQVVSDYCQVAKIIIASRQDTAETLRSIRAENAKIRKLCKTVEPKQ
jgi:hypothetical protein